MIQFQKVRIYDPLVKTKEHDLTCTKCKCLYFSIGEEKIFLKDVSGFWKVTKWHCRDCSYVEEVTEYISTISPPPPKFST